MNLGVNIPEYEVSQFNRLFKEVVETNFDYIRIRGEISDIKNASSGHVYITLKDKDSVLNATLWSQKKIHLQFAPEKGMDVIVSGKISTYAKSISTYSLNIDKLELAGEGALLKLIEERTKRLKEKGLFEQIHKKKIPFLPNKIGVITSITGSVIHDIINRIKDRFPTDIDIWPVSVQGIGASSNIINAINGFNSDKYNLPPSVIIIARGGGNTEDLMTFNDEELALAVFNSSIPIISAIGHETDNTIIDFVSDLRASTPTAAAEKAVPMQSELNNKIMSISQRLFFLLEMKFKNKNSELLSLSKLIKAPNFVINIYKEKFDKMNLSLLREIENIYKSKLDKLSYIFKLLHSPENTLADEKRKLIYLQKTIDRNVLDKHTQQKKDLNKFVRLIESNSLHSNLKKGYSIIRKSKKIINKSTLLNDNDTMNIQFLDKKIDINIKKIN